MQLPSEIKIKSSFKNYSVNFYEKVYNFLNEPVLRDNDILIVDSNIEKSYDMNIPNTVIKVQANESSKSFQNLSLIIQDLLDAGAKRTTRLVAIGGGIIQDIVGFVSSILFRGIKWLFVPTTLLSQGDSCIGGKTSINFGKFKNQLGNFNPPDEIHICLEFLDTLSEIDRISGIGEMSHFHFVSSRKDVEYFKKYYIEALSGNKQEMINLISSTLNIKKNFIEDDEFDKGRRLLLNYGHSFGHAIELETKNEIPHGLAVCYGMMISNMVSKKSGYLTSEEFEYMNDILQNISQNKLSSKLGQSIDSFIKALKKDKKNVTNNPRVVLTKGIGNMFLTDLRLSADNIRFLKKCFEEIKT